MKHVFLLVLLSILISVTLSCSSDEPQRGVIENGDQEESCDSIEFMLLTNIEQQSQPIPRLMISYGDWSIVEIADRNNPGLITLQFLNKNDKSSVLVVADNERATFVDYDVMNGTVGDIVYVIQNKNDSICGMKLNMNWDTNGYEVIESTIIPNHATSKMLSRSFQEDNDDIRKLVYDMLSNLENKISIIGLTGNAICEVWTNLVLPIARYQLYSDDPEKLEEIAGDVFSGNLKDYIINIFLTDDIQQALSIVSVLLKNSNLPNLSRIIELINNNIISKVEDPQEVLSPFSRTVDFSKQLHKTNTEAFSGYYNKYALSVSVSNVTETTAEVYGTFDELDGIGSYISEYGFRYGIVGGNAKTEKVSTFPTKLMLTNLQPGTQYWIVSYIRNYGTDFVSPKKYFTTDATFELYPSSLTFEADGGEKAVSVTLPNDDWTWSISSCPSWCEISGEARNSFFVKADASSSDREGVIEVTAHSSFGNTVTQSLLVQQLTSQSLVYKGIRHIKYWEDRNGEINSVMEYDLEDTASILKMGNSTQLIYTLMDGVMLGGWEIGDNTYNNIFVPGATIHKMNIKTTRLSESQFEISGEIQYTSYANLYYSKTFNMTVDVGGSITCYEFGSYTDFNSGVKIYQESNSELVLNKE